MGWLTDLSVFTNLNLICKNNDIVLKLTKLEIKKASRKNSKRGAGVQPPTSLFIFVLLPASYYHFYPTGIVLYDLLPIFSGKFLDSFYLASSEIRYSYLKQICFFGFGFGKKNQLLQTKIDGSPASPVNEYSKVPFCLHLAHHAPLFTDMPQPRYTLFS